MTEKEVVVFISGCFDIIHGGHIEMFEEAKSLGTKLILHIAGDESLWTHKHRISSLPIEHKVRVYSELSVVDEVLYTTDEDLKKHNTTLGLDFEQNFLRVKPDILAVTTDDRYEELKRELCSRTGTKYVVLGKTISESLKTRTSTTQIVSRIKTPTWVPLRVDFGGGWLDVPKLSRPDGFIVNCSVVPGVSKKDWNGYKVGSGLGGSGANFIVSGENGVEGELKMGAGWQDPAIIYETGLCVWRSGKWPVLHLKRNPCHGEHELNLMGKMALLWIGKLTTDSDTPGSVDNKRDLEKVYEAGKMGKEAVEECNFEKLCRCVDLSYAMQIEEGLKVLPELGEVCKKHCGSGGYAVYIFESRAKRDRFVEEKKGRVIEPFVRMYRPRKEEEKIIKNGYE